jgi:hypothetical protein
MYRLIAERLDSKTFIILDDLKPESIIADRVMVRFTTTYAISAYHH